MARAHRIDVADEIYHVLNRANDKHTIFRKDQDYLAFEEIIFEGIELFGIKLYVYEIMPNHWHLVLSTRRDGEMGRFMAWITGTHSMRLRTHYDSVGYGHVYQGRYKSFMVETDAYFYRVCRYVERNALRAGLVVSAEEWRWGSTWVRMHGTDRQKRMLSPWPVEMPDDYLISLNEADESDATKETLEEIRAAVNKGTPFGTFSWKESLVKRFGPFTGPGPTGRPKKG